MGLIERVRAQQMPQAAWPVGTGVVHPGDREFGHDDEQFSPEKYGNYIATSNEVFSAAMLRARAIGSMSLRLFDQDGPEKAETTRGSEYDLLRHVNPFWTRRRLSMMDELSMCLWGESHWAVERDRAGRPSEIWWMKSSRVRPVPHEEDYLSGFLYTPANGGPDIRFDADEVVWFRYPNPLDEFSALSPMAAARLAADSASAMMRSNRNLFTEGLQMGGVVTPDTDKVSFSEDQATELSKMLRQRFRGADKAHRWAVLRYEAKFQKMQVSPRDAEFVSGLNLTLRQVCNAYGVPAPLLNEMSAATLSNAREYERLLWTHALVPDSQLRSEEIVEQFLPMFRGSRVGWAEYDYSKVAALQESETERWGREAAAIERGAITINEWRKQHGMPPVPWGNVWWAGANRFAVDGPDSTPGDDVSPAAPTTVDGADALALLDAFAVRPEALNGHRLTERTSP